MTLLVSRRAEDRSSTPRDLKARGRKEEYQGGQRLFRNCEGMGGKEGDKMAALRGVSIEKRSSPSRNGRWEEIRLG